MVSKPTTHSRYNRYPRPLLALVLILTAAWIATDGTLQRKNDVGKAFFDGWWRRSGHPR